MTWQLHHVQLAMPEGQEEAARAFWVGVLGFSEVAKPAALAVRGGAWFRRGHVDIHVGGEPAFRPAKKAHPAFFVDDIDAVAARFAAADIAVRRDDESMPSYRRFHVDDPFGNRLEFLGFGTVDGGR